MRVLISDGLAKDGLEKIKQIPGLEVSAHSALERGDLLKVLPEYEILVVRSRTQVDRALLDAGPRLRLVVRAGIGLDNIDVPAATDRGVVVMNAPTGNIVTTAEHALALLFAATRHIAQADSSMRRGEWEKKKFQGNELRGKTLGVVGLGNIGKTVADRAIGLKLKVVGYDPYLSEEAAARLGVTLMSLDELLRVSDYVTVHVPLLENTRHLIGKDAFQKMKPGAYLINCARGGIVDEAALIEALEAGKLTGAALDVFETEPLPKDHPLLKRDDVVLTPHLGASTDEAQVQVGLEVAEQLSLFVAEGAYKNAVNVPNISVEQMERLKPYIVLGEKLGSFAAQVGQVEKVSRLKVSFESVDNASDREIIQLSVLKGFLGSFLSSQVNFVNAKKLLKERSICLEASFSEAAGDFGTLIGLEVEGTKKFSVAGTLFGKKEPRIVRIEGFTIDTVPFGWVLFTRNTDKPGVIGALGTTLGGCGTNIARMHLGRDKSLGEAIAVLGLDSEIPAQTLEQVRKIPGMLSAILVKL